MKVRTSNTKEGALSIERAFSNPIHSFLKKSKDKAGTLIRV